MKDKEIQEQIDFIDANFRFSVPKIIPKEEISKKVILAFTLGGLYQVLKSKFDTGYIEAKHICFLWKRKNNKLISSTTTPETLTLNKHEQKRVDYLNGGFQKVIHICRSEGGYLNVLTEMDDKIKAPFKYSRHIVGKRGGVHWIKKGSVYDHAQNIITDESFEKYYF
jgi:hypothetical protein